MLHETSRRERNLQEDGLILDLNSSVRGKAITFFRIHEEGKGRGYRVLCRSLGGGDITAGLDNSESKFSNARKTQVYRVNEALALKRIFCFGFPGER